MEQLAPLRAARAPGRGRGRCGPANERSAGTPPANQKSRMGGAGWATAGARQRGFAPREGRGSGGTGRATPGPDRRSRAGVGAVVMVTPDCTDARQQSTVWSSNGWALNISLRKRLSALV